MAMNGKALGDAVAAVLKAKHSSLSSEAYTELKSNWEEIGGAGVDYLTANMVVTTPAGVTVSTTGSASAQTGATTAPGIGSVS